MSHLGIDLPGSADRHREGTARLAPFFLRLDFEAWVSLTLSASTAIFAAGYAYAASRLKVPPMVDPLGPKAFPYVIAAALLICSVFLAVEGLARRKGVEAIAEAKPFRLEPEFVVTLGVIVWNSLYFVLFTTLGYVVATTLFLFVLTAFFNRGHQLINLAVSVGFSVLTYISFTWLLQVQLPPGLLPY